MNKFILIVLFVLMGFWPCECEAQWFKRSRGGYQTTSDGYNYKGRRYTLGVDGPVSSACNCPMCQRLRAALNRPYTQSPPYIQTYQTYTPQPYTLKSNVYVEDVATPTLSIDEMLRILNPKRNSILLDPGCGDARILIRSAEMFNTRGLGVEINETTYKTAMNNVNNNSLLNRISVYNSDSRTKSFANADNVALFLFPSLIKDLTPKFLTLKSGSKVISYKHTIPLEGTVKVGDFYLWTRP